MKHLSFRAEFRVAKRSRGTSHSSRRHETVRDGSHSTPYARSGEAFNMAASPFLIGCNVTLPLEMTERGSDA
jgi:hypothetical protein